jgi:hypothetical protein
MIRINSTEGAERTRRKVAVYSDDVVECALFIGLAITTILILLNKAGPMSRNRIAVSAVYSFTGDFAMQLMVKGLHRVYYSRMEKGRPGSLGMMSVLSSLAATPSGSFLSFSKGKVMFFALALMTRNFPDQAANYLVPGSPGYA